MIVIDNHSQCPSSAHRGDCLDYKARLWRQDQRLIKQWGPRDDVTTCPRSRYHFIDVDTAEVVGRSRCGLNSCIYCLRVRSRQYHRAVTLAGPTALITLTRMSGTWQQDRGAVKQMVRDLKRTDHLTISLAWAIEPNPKGTGYHAHGWVCGDHVPDETFDHRARMAGFGSIDVEPVTYVGNFSYPMKNAIHNEASLAEHLRLNGQEPLHARGFWRDQDTGEQFPRDEAVRRSSRGFGRSGATLGLVPVCTVGHGS